VIARRRRVVRLLAFVPVVGLLAGAAFLGSAGSTESLAEIDPRVLEDTAEGRTGPFLVVLDEQAETRLTAVRSGERAQLVVEALQTAAGQRDIRAHLRRLGARFRPFWIINAIAVEGTRAVVEAMAARADVASIETNRAFHAPLGVRSGSSLAASEWNIEKIGAPALWKIGVTGEGVVYANADSGVVWDHPALRPHYRGWNGSTATHDYNWWDAVHGDLDGDGANPCGFNAKVPCDDAPNSHGTHTMGTGVGDDGAGNQVGVAPGAKWMACRNMENGTGRPSTYLECYQFFLAPTDLNGVNPDPSRRPNVVGNSYACPPSEGCGVGALQGAVDNLRAAGIFMAVSAGNEGREGCGSLHWPPATYDSAVSVGATGQNDTIAVFSSRGPVLADGSGRTKPDLVAPGVGIRSAVRSGYATFSGTSMAAPHVAGAVALLWSAFPNLRGNVDRTEQLLEQTAAKLPTSEACGGNTSTQVPNNTFGYGRIDVQAAYRAAEAESPAALSATDVSVAEGTAGTRDAAFVVMLSRPSLQTVSVQFTTADGTAAAGSDYRSTSGTLTFAPGEKEKTIAVPVIGDTQMERNETFSVRLSSPTNATLVRDRVAGTITNDDADKMAPVLRMLSLRPGSFRAAAGALVRYVLTEPATTTFIIKRATTTVRRLIHRGRKGPNSFRLTGRALQPGSYRLVATPRDPAGNTGRPVGVAFRIQG
jgi:serine protease AprX